ncbi:unnamed protein product [Pylaiella littoralis]
MFAVSSAAMHEVYGLRRGDVAFFLGAEQLEPVRWCLADRVEVRFWSSKGDQFRKGAVVTRVRKGPPCSVQDGGAAVDLMVELLLYYPTLPSHAPLVAVASGADGWRLWSKHQVVSALRQIVALGDCRRQSYRALPAYWGRQVFGGGGGATGATAYRG